MKADDKKAVERYRKKLELIRQAVKVNTFESISDRKAAIVRAKKDIRFCVERYFPHYARYECADFHIQWANKVKKDKTFTGFCKWGRGLAKSVWNNIFIPFWLWLNGENVYFVLVAVSEDKASRLLNDLKAEFEANPQIKADFGEQHNPGSWEDKLWITRGGFIGQAMGFGQSCRGLRVGPLRPTYYNVDDLETKLTIKNEKRQDEMVEWVEDELLGSMDSPEETERLLFSNNWFAPVMFLKKLAKKHPDWYIHEVKAYNAVTFEPVWKAKYTSEYYRKKSKKMGSTSADSEYNHNPVLRGGKIFKAKYIQWIKLPRIDYFKAIVGHWDIAYAGNETSDFNAVRIWGLYKNDFYYIDSFVKQTKMKPAVKYMIAVDREMKAKGINIIWRAESQFWNDEVIRTVKEACQEEGNYQLSITLVYEKNNKFTKIITRLEARYQNGRIYYNIKKESHTDTQIGLQQLYGISPGYSTHDDAPDADSEAVEYLSKFITEETENSDSQIMQGTYQSNYERI